MRRRVLFPSIFASCCLSLIACAEQTAPPTEEDDKLMYFLGTALSRNIEPLGLSEAELDYVILGLRDALAGNPMQLNENEYSQRLQQFGQERVTARASAESSLADTYIDKMAAEAGASVTESGIVIRELVAGEGAQPAADSVVRAHYHGTLRDGTVFDSSVERGQPFEAGLNRVIPCWTEAIQTMKVGGKSKITCPSDLAYGPSGTGSIPGGAALTFEVELLDIVE